MDGTARAVADLAEGEILASVEVAAAPERVFRALASQDIVNWWVRPSVFDTREWAGDEDFDDYCHLRPEGADHFSARIGQEVLRPWLEGAPLPRGVPQRGRLAARAPGPSRRPCAPCARAT